MKGWRLYCRKCRRPWQDFNDEPSRRCPFCSSLLTTVKPGASS